MESSSEVMDGGGEGAEEEDVYNSPSYPILPQVDMEDWQYVMRRTMQEIIPGLFLGKSKISNNRKKIS
jgi:hypothetical protein